MFEGLVVQKMDVQIIGTFTVSIRYACLYMYMYIFMYLQSYIYMHCDLAFMVAADITRIVELISSLQDRK